MMNSENSTKCRKSQFPTCSQQQRRKKMKINEKGEKNLKNNFQLLSQSHSLVLLIHCKIYFIYDGKNGFTTLKYETELKEKSIRQIFCIFCFQTIIFSITINHLQFFAFFSLVFFCVNALFCCLVWLQ